MFGPVMLLKYLVIVIASKVALTLHHQQNDDLTSELIEEHGYMSETHHITTSDGYVLRVHRIPYGRDGPSSGRRPPVLLMHGLFASSSHFVAMGPEFSIGFNLVDAGFDVWMGNGRGNRFSRRHITLDPDHPEEKFEFFDISWEDIGLYDIPSITDYVRENTGSERIHYIGHSQGTTAFFVLNSMRPEYNKYFASAHLLAPVAYMEHFPNPVLSGLAVFTDTVYNLAISNGLVELGQNILDALEINNGKPHSSDVWSTIIREIEIAKGINQISDKDFAVSDFFGGASIKQVAHYGQNIRSSNFQRWDFGLLQNREVYGTLRPPIYDLSQITVDTTLHYTTADVLTGVDDVLEIERVLPNAEARRIANEDFTHSGFVFDPDVKELVTDYIIEKLRAAENFKLN